MRLRPHDRAQPVISSGERPYFGAPPEERRENKALRQRSVSPGGDGPEFSRECHASRERVGHSHSAACAIASLSGVEMIASVSTMLSGLRLLSW